MSSLMDDANAPVVFKGHEYGPLTMADAARLQAAIQIPEESKALLDIADILKFARSPRGIPMVIKIAAEKTGAEQNGLSTGEQIELAVALVARFYGTSGRDDEEAAKASPLSQTGAS